MQYCVTFLYYNLVMNTYDSYYPRPLLRRDSFLCLNDGWTLNGQSINLPFAPESSLSGYEGNADRMEYRKTFALDKKFYSDNDKVILHFGAVDQLCDVYLNDKHLIHHEGGYLPFSIDITDHLEETNKLKVIAIDELDYFYPYGKQTKKPHGMWYTPVSGIWQSVWLEAYDRNGIDSITVDTDMDTLNIHIESGSESFTVSFDDYIETFHDKDISIKVKDPILWSPDNPHLYDLYISTANDHVSSYFALKKISVKEVNGYKRLFLNDEPLFVNGLLDQGYFPDGIFMPGDIDGYAKDISSIKELGYNCLRKHIKVEPEVFYHECDRQGILVFQDMVNSGKYDFFVDTVLSTIGLQKLPKPLKDRKRYDFFINHAKETIRHLKSHPCIIGYTIYNEGWGQQNASGSYDILKPCDPDRLFDSTSGWFFDDHSDFDSYHRYFKNQVFKAKDKILSISECGGFIRDIAEHRSDKGSKWGYGSADSEDGLTDKIIDMHNHMVIPSIMNGLCMVIMTQISDVEGEINGLFTYDRQICKVNKEKILEANMKLKDIYNKQCI